MGRDELLSRHPVLDPAAAQLEVDGERVVVTPRDSTLHTLNPVGSRVLALADGSRSVAAIVAAVVAEYEVEEQVAEADVCAFVEELVEKGVLVLAGPQAP